MRRVQAPTGIFLTALTIILSTSTIVSANTRTLETRFALSSDIRSEFSTRFPLLGPGRVLIEADWKAATATGSPISLTLVLVRPDGVAAARKSGSSILRLEHSATAQDLESFTGSSDPKWTVKILNDAAINRIEVSGTLRITVPTGSRVLEDTQFTLLGSGNAQEIPFNVPAPGRVEIEVGWQPDAVSTSVAQIPLTVSFIHPGESRTYARRQGASPVRVDHQITDEALDRGARWIVRVQNESQTKVRGRIKITYRPSL